MPGLATQIEVGSIRSLESAAAWRRSEAKVLQNGGKRLAELYWLGYVVEMSLCAACYRVLGYDPQTPIKDNDRRECEKQARAEKLMGTQPHDLAGWSQYLVFLRNDLAQPLNKKFAFELTENAEAVFEHWRPRLRYKTLVPTEAQLRQVRTSTDWINQQYNQMWR